MNTSKLSYKEISGRLQEAVSVLEGADCEKGPDVECLIGDFFESCLRCTVLSRLKGDPDMQGDGEEVCHKL